VSILLVGLSETLSVKTLQRLHAQGDEVRILLGDRSEESLWKDLGAHVAVGDIHDEDLVWRATTGVRTIVLGDEADLEALDPVLAGSARAGVGRVVLCLAAPSSGTVDRLRGTELEFVVLTTGRRSLIGRPKVKLPISKLAEAIDAADDLEGRLRLELDLTNPEAWRVLRVLAPDEL
jgi:hypothetical protein